MNLWKEIYLPLAIIACTPLLTLIWNDIVTAIDFFRGFLEWRKQNILN